MCNFDPYCPGQTDRPLTSAERRIARPLRRTSKHAVLGPWRICETCKGVFCTGTITDFGFALLVRRGHIDEGSDALLPSNP